jgi:hypothetical protein
LRLAISRVLNTSNFIIEEFIRGEEYVTIITHDNNGDAVLLNVLHHLFLLRNTRPNQIIEKYKIDLEYFLSKIGKELHI